MKRNSQSQNLASHEGNVNDVRLKAVLLRQAGSTLAQVKDVTRLSTSTIIALNKAYGAGGIKALESRKIGRPPKNNSSSDESTQNQWASIWDELFRSPSDHLWTFELLAQWLNERPKESGASDSKPRNRLINKRTAMRLFREWWWTPPTASAISISFLEEASKRKLFVFSGGQFTLPNRKQNAQLRGLLFAQDRRGKLFWSFYQHPLEDQDYVDFAKKLMMVSPKGYALKWSFAGLQYSPALAAWLTKNAKMVLLHNTRDVDVVNAAHKAHDYYAVAQSTSFNTSDNRATQLSTSLLSHSSSPPPLSARYCYVSRFQCPNPLTAPRGRKYSYSAGGCGRSR